METFKISSLLFGAKMNEGKNPFNFVVQVYMHMIKLFAFSFCMDHVSSVDIILSCLNESCAPFVFNYHINGKIHIIPDMITLLNDREHTFEQEGKFAILWYP